MNTVKGLSQLAVTSVVAFLMTACSVHGGSSDSAPGLPKITGDGNLIPSAPAAPAPGKGGVDLSQCPDLAGTYENTQFGTPLDIVFSKVAGGYEQFTMTSVANPFTIDGVFRKNSDSSESVGKCINGEIDLVGKQDTGKAYHNLLKKTATGVDLINLDPSDATNVLLTMSFSSKE